MEADPNRGGIWWLRLLCVFLLASMFVMLAFGSPFVPVFVAITLLVCLFTMLLMHPDEDHVACHKHTETTLPAPEDDIPEGIQSVLDVESQRRMGDAAVYRGRLKAGPDEVQERLRTAFAGSGNVPVIQEDMNGEPAILVVPEKYWPSSSIRVGFPWTNLLLFVATILTTTWAGALHAGVNILEEPAKFAVGLPYSFALLAILGTHELGHYFAARAHRMNVSLPFFIPVPFALGTFGAFIQLRSPAEDRKALFDMAAAGPLAGLVVAIPALAYGLGQSEVVAEVADGMQMHRGVNVGSSMLLAIFAKFSLGDALTSGHVIRLHPIAFAGWLGVFITALNLLPVGQLDGGHISDAMFGSRRSAWVSRMVLFALFFLAIFVWAGLLLWAFIILLIAGRKGLTSLNALTPLTGGRLAVGWFAYLLLAAIILPVPHSFYTNFGIHCPYF